MRLRTLADELDRGGERNVAGELPPDVVEFILREPHVRAATGNRVGILGSVEGNGARMFYVSDVRVISKRSERSRCGKCVSCGE